MPKPSGEELDEAAHHAHTDSLAAAGDGHHVGIETGGQVGGDDFDLEGTSPRR
jgi:hypothetical protein